PICDTLKKRILKYIDRVGFSFPPLPRYADSTCSSMASGSGQCWAISVCLLYRDQCQFVTLLKKRILKSVPIVTTAQEKDFDQCQFVTRLKKRILKYIDRIMGYLCVPPLPSGAISVSLLLP
ncbi:hypothetical protein L9F63_016673, partial [Diploptera punctata]